MPVTVTASKNKTSIITLIACLVVVLIPLGIIALISIKNKAVWTNAYSIYVYAMIGVHLYFSIIIGLIAWRSKKAYTICELITVILVSASVLLSYIFAEFKGGVLLHVGAGVLFTYFVYKLGDMSDKSDVMSRYFPPVVLTLTGLITCLWFISVHMSVGVHKVIATISNLIFGIFSIVLFVKFFKTHAIDRVEESEYQYEEETEEEIAARKAKKKQLKLELNEEFYDGQEVIVEPGMKYRVDPWSIDWLIKGLNKFYEEECEYLNDLYESAHNSIDYEWDNATTSTDFNDCNSKYRSLNRWVKRYQRAFDSNYKKFVRFVNELGNRVFTSEDCGYYYEYHLHSCWIKKRKIASQDRFKIAMSGIVQQISFRLALFDKYSKTAEFDDNYIHLIFEEI